MRKENAITALTDKIMLMKHFYMKLLQQNRLAPGLEKQNLGYTVYLMETSSVLRVCIYWSCSMQSFPFLTRYLFIQCLQPFLNLSLFVLFLSLFPSFSFHVVFVLSATLSVVTLLMEWLSAFAHCA